LNVVKIQNIGPHAHVEFFGISLELMTIFGKFGQNGQKNWVGQFGGVKILRYVLTTPHSCTSLQTTNNSLSYVKF